MVRPIQAHRLPGIDRAHTDRAVVQPTRRAALLVRNELEVVVGHLADAVPLVVVGEDALGSVGEGGDDDDLAVELEHVGALP